MQALPSHVLCGLALMYVQVAHAQHCFVGRHEKPYPSDQCAQKISELAEVGLPEIPVLIPLTNTDLLRTVATLALQIPNVEISPEMRVALNGAANEFLQTLVKRTMDGAEVGWHVGSNVGWLAGGVVGGQVGGNLGAGVGIGAGFVAGPGIVAAQCSLTGAAMLPCMAAGGAFIASTIAFGAVAGGTYGAVQGFHAGAYLGEKIGGSLGALSGGVLGSWVGALDGVVFQFGQGLFLAVTTNKDGVPCFRLAILPPKI